MTVQPIGRSSRQRGPPSIVVTSLGSSVGVRRNYGYVTILREISAVRSDRMSFSERSSYGVAWDGDCEPVVSTGDVTRRGSNG